MKSVTEHIEQIKEKALFSDGEINGCELYINNKPSNLPFILKKIINKYKKNLSDDSLRYRCYTDKIFLSSDYMSNREILDFADGVSSELEDIDIYVNKITTM